MNNSINPLLTELIKIRQLLEKIDKKLDNDEPKNDQYLNVKQVAKIVKKSPGTIRWITNDKIQGIKMNAGKKQDPYLISKEELERFINQGNTY